jgi:DNA invertase Pin-like site-specific DNA recombinase
MMKSSNRTGEANDATSSMRRRLRCAIYTRKSSEEGLEQEFNSLDAQREACEAYILSQKHDGWIALPAYYDDGGLSGGNMERPALKRLLEDVSAGRVDVIVVYKVDRLTRSLSDFARIVDTLNKHQVSFVSVTQHFNTTSSMGRLTLNVLLSFAQFEREIAGERIRDKIAASKRKGMWMGGTIPFGYQVNDRRLEIVESEATTLRLMFKMYAQLGTVEALMEYLIHNGITNQRDHTAHQTASSTTDQSANQTVPTAFSRGALYHILKNPLYIGKTTHKGTSYDGLHEAIIDDALWTKVQQKIADNTNNQTSGRRSKHPSLLVGKILTDDGQMLTPTHTVKRGVRYRYYINQKAEPKSKIEGNARPPIIRIPAPAIERLVTDRLLTLLRSQTELAALLHPLNLSASQLREIIQKAQETADRWSSKSAADQRTILHNILIKVCLRNDHVELQLSRSSLLQSLIGPTLSNSSHTVKSAEHPSADPDDDVVCIQTTTCLEPSGNGLRLIINDTNQASPNMQLAPLLGEAFMLREELLNGSHDSIESMSKALQTTNGYISARIRLTYLSPSLIKKILNGDVSNTISPTRLIDASKDLPVKWGEQDRFIEALAR